MARPDEMLRVNFGEDRRTTLRMCLAIARWWEVHCSLFAIRSNTVVRLVPRFSERMQTTAYPSPCFQLSESGHCLRNLCHNSQDLWSGSLLPEQVGEQQVTEVCSATSCDTSGAHRCPSVVNRWHRSVSPMRWTLWTSVRAVGGLLWSARRWQRRLHIAYPTTPAPCFLLAPDPCGARGRCGVDRPWLWTSSTTVERDT